MRRSHEIEGAAQARKSLTSLSAMIRTRRQAKNEISTDAYVVQIRDTISVLRLPILSGPIKSRNVRRYSLFRHMEALFHL